MRTSRLLAPKWAEKHAEFYSLKSFVMHPELSSAASQFRYYNFHSIRRRVVIIVNFAK